MSSGNPQDSSRERLRLWLRLLSTTRGVEAQLRERLRTEFGSTLPRFDVLAALSRHPDGLKMNEVSQQLKVSNGNVTGVVSRLVRDGLVERFAIEGDRRAIRIALSDAGQDQFTSMATAHKEWVNNLLSHISADTAHHMSELLAHLPNDPGEHG